MSEKPAHPLAVRATDVATRNTPSSYPSPFAERMAGREKRQLGNVFGLSNFGVNLTTLAPGAQSALMHRHSRQDEFVYVLQGTATLRTDQGDVELSEGMCAGFPHGGLAHQIVNRSDEPVTYLEIGDRTPGDEGTYPEDDIKAVMGEDGKWRFTHKDGTPFAS
ncbi:MAG: cupin domain-containing protein [bacterium]